MNDDLGIELDIPKPNEQGGGGLYFLDAPCHQYVWMHSIFSKEQLEAIVNIGKSATLESGITPRGNDKMVRNSKVAFLYPNDITGWIFSKLSDIVQQANKDYFNFELHGMFQGLQFTVYDENGSHYSWHQDLGLNAGTRKLSLSLQLSSPEDYEGGDLELRFGKETEKVVRQQGVVAFFPSWVLHRVTPVTRGTRYSLVAWVSGPAFK